MVYAFIKQKPSNATAVASHAGISDKKDTVQAMHPSTNADSAVATDSVVACEDAAVSGEVNQKQVSIEKSKYIYHLVQPGDTLWNIARRYDGVTVELLKEVNNFTPSSTLKIGSKIKVPDKSLFKWVYSS